VNGLLAIAESFIDRMTNPRYGPAANEEYALRFTEVLNGDPGFAAELANLSLDPEDIDSLPACAWPWYLEWRRLEDAPPPPANFLDVLFAATDDPAIRLAVVQSALSERVADSSPDNFPDAAPDRVSEFSASTEERGAIRSRWLRSQAARLTHAGEPAQTLPDAIELATYLLQIGDSDSLASLLSLPWPGRAALLDAIGGQLADANLEPETAAAWRSRLGLDRPDNDG
jgi:hypothetical protein